LKNIENDKKVSTSPNTRLTLRRLFGGSGSSFARSVASLAPTQIFHHIFATLILLRKPLFGLQKRRQA
jgi:hypothetical protein